MRPSPLAVAGALAMLAGAAHVLALIWGLLGIPALGLGLLGIGALLVWSERRLVGYVAFLVIGFGASAMLAQLVGGSALPLWVPAVALASEGAALLGLFLALWRAPAPSPSSGPS